MSIVSEITRIQGAKNTLKAKLNEKNDEQHQITNETLDEFGDFVDSIETGIEPTGEISIIKNGTYDVTNYASADVNVSGGSQVINTYSQFKTAIDKMVSDFDTLAQNRVSLYPVYTNEPITLYYPKSSSFYIIHKRSNGKYRIIWSIFPYATVYEETSVGFSAMALPLNYYNRYSTLDNRNKFNTIKDISLKDKSDYIVFYYSKEFDTIEQLIAEASSPTGAMSYSEWNTSGRFSGVLDTPYEITFSNCPVFDARNNYEFLMSRKISSNETYISLG